MYRIAKKFRFEASHQLTGLPEGHPCTRLHGHSYEVELVLSAPLVYGPGFVVDYRDLAPFKDLLDRELDHRHLNDVLNVNPTAENLAESLYQQARHLFESEHSTVIVAAVRVSETPKTWAEYSQ